MIGLATPLTDGQRAWDEAYGWSPGGASGSSNVEGHGEGMGFGDAQYTNEAGHTCASGCLEGGGNEIGWGGGDALGGVPEFLPGGGNTFFP